MKGHMFLTGHNWREWMKESFHLYSLLTPYPGSFMTLMSYAHHCLNNIQQQAVIWSWCKVHSQDQPCLMSTLEDWLGNEKILAVNSEKWACFSFKSWSELKLCCVSLILWHFYHIIHKVHAWQAPLSLWSVLMKYSGPARPATGGD